MTTVIVIFAAVILFGVLLFGLIKYPEDFRQKWLPSFITGVFLVATLPVANEFYWRRQKQFEACVQDRDRRYELLGSTANTYTSLFKVHTQLYHLGQERSKQERAIRRLAAQKGGSQESVQIPNSRVLALNAQISELIKERIRLEGQLGADSALIARYLPGAWQKYAALAAAYDQRTSRAEPFFPGPKEPLVLDAQVLISAMAKEAMEREC